MIFCKTWNVQINKKKAESKIIWFCFRVQFDASGQWAHLVPGPETNPDQEDEERDVAVPKDVEVLRSMRTPAWGGRWRSWDPELLTWRRPWGQTGRNCVKVCFVVIKPTQNAGILNKAGPTETLWSISRGTLSTTEFTPSLARVNNKEVYKDTVLNSTGGDVPEKERLVDILR